MRGGLRQKLAMLGIFAVLLHTMLSALMMPVAAATGSFDPLSYICHSGPDGAPADDASPAGQPAKPSAACDHCNLCSATGAANAPDVIIAGRLLPERVLVLLDAADVARRDGVTSDPKQARGPPQQA